MRAMLLLCSALLAASCLNAESIFTLRGIDKVYPVVEISGRDVPRSEKAYIRDAVKTITEELGIGTKGYSQRSLAVLVNEKYVGKTPYVTVRLIIGEQVRRLDSDEKVFGITYEESASFVYRSETVAEKLEDSVDELLEKFADQYREEHGSIKRVAEKGDDIAAALGYGTNYAKAVETAKAQHKNVMLVLVSNYCPWCRKFEEQVLRKQEVNDLVHEKYVPVILNKEKDSFPAAFNLSFTPIVHFIDPRTQQSYHRVVGYNERDAFLHWLRTDKGPR
jgi:hypothetical protein